MDADASSPGAQDMDAYYRRLRVPIERRWASDMISSAQILDDCIINQNFRATDDWIRPLRLTPLGSAVVSAVMGADKKLRKNEVVLATFLRIGCPAGLFVDRATDADELRELISAALLNRRIFLPYIFGRELHDSAAEEYPEQTRLDNSKSVRLLQHLPIGVFQSGHLVTGPFGCLHSSQARSIPPTRIVPGYLCSDPTCHRVHTIYMETTDTAPVVRAGRAVRVYLGSAYPGVDEFARITRSALQQEADSFRHPGREAVIDTLADGLLLSELRAVTGQVLRRRLSAVESSFRLDLSRAVGYAILNPDDFVSELDRSKLLQVLLLSDDEEIYRGIDAAIASGELRMAEYDVRVERVSRTSPATRAELGVMGVRVREKGVRTYVAGRLLRLIHHLFFVSGVQSREDLQYLAGPDTRELSDSDLLNHVVHSISPDEVLDKLVTSTRASAIAAAEYFWISEPERLTSADLRRILLWKLGLPGAIAFGDIATLDERLRELRNSAESSVGEDVVRGQISNVFAAFEDVLQRSLAFTCWALATDHLTTTAGFEYDPSSSASGLRVLDELAPVDDAALALRQSGKNTLAPLGAGFGRLAKALVRVVPNDFVRPESHLPDICRFSDRPFAFAHTVPFLDLDSAARDELARTIGSVASAAQDDVVLTVRNSTLHGNNIFPSSAAVTAAVDVLSACSSALRRSGLFPTVFELEMRSVDGFGRETVTFRSDRSRVKLSSPHWAVTRRMPTSSDRLVIMPAARLSSVGPLRFRLKSNLTGDDYWDGWPRRWQERRDYDSSLDSDADEVSSAIAS